MYTKLSHLHILSLSKYFQFQVESSLGLNLITQDMIFHTEVVYWGFEIYILI